MKENITGTFLIEKEKIFEIIMIEKRRGRELFHVYTPDDSKIELSWNETQADIEKALAHFKITKLDKVIKGPPRQKPLSRAGRCGKGIEALNNITSEIQCLIDDVKRDHEDDECDVPEAEMGKFCEQVNSLIGQIDVSVFEDLRDELQDWKDNLPESLQYSQKADDLESAIQELEQGIGELEYINDADDVNDAEAAISDIETAISTLECISFPGMFG